MECAPTEGTKLIDLVGTDFGTDAEWRKDIGLDTHDENLSETRFEHFFPCTKVNVFIDENYSSRRLPCHAKVKKEKIAFYDLNHEDRDNIVELFCLIMIAAVSVEKHRAEKLWSRDM